MTTSRRCSELDAVLSAYVDHEATADEMATIEAHARTCKACASRLRRYQALTPRLEADLRALVFKADAAAAGQMKRAHFRGPPDRFALVAPRVPLFSRLATVALVLAVAVVVGIVLLRSAPVGQVPGVETGAQPSAPAAAVQTPNSPDRAPILVASISGLIDPAVAAYVHRAVSAAEDSHAGALVVVLDASGGLDGPMQQVAQDLAGSSVPTLAFIPPGRADVADARLAQSSALVGAIPAPSLDAFLLAVDGQQARTPAGPVTLATGGARIETLDMEPGEAVAHRLMDPTTAYLLFVLGLYAAFVELAHPGSLVPGATGLVCLTLASVAFAMLPTNWLGVAVLVAAVGLMALELKAATHGALVLAGVGCLVVGSVLLYAAPGSWLPLEAAVAIPPAVLIGAVGAGLIVGLLLARIAQRIHSLPPILSLEQLIGARGVSRGGLDPEGVVHVGGQLWSARLRGGSLGAGQPVRVVARHGLVLEVESATLGAATRKGTLS
jgi:membrane-bound ClpP family serine protease